MDGILAVTPSALRACAGNGQAIGESVSGLEFRAADACDKAAGAHGAWNFGAELTALAPLWRRQLTGQGSAISGDAVKLHRSADTYTTAENMNIALVHSAFSPASAGI